jgi:hypothetical protein
MRQAMADSGSFNADDQLVVAFVSGSSVRRPSRLRMTPRKSTATTSENCGGLSFVATRESPSVSMHVYQESLEDFLSQVNNRPTSGLF